MKIADNYIVDTTLRDGEQAPGVVFFQSEKIEIAKHLDLLGIEELEIGSPAMGTEEIADMKAIVALKCNFKSIAWCRALKKDIESAALCGTDAINISFPVSDIHLAAMQKNRAWLLKTLAEIIPMAQTIFRNVYVGLQDASRANKEFLLQVIHEALLLNAERIRIADTVGIMHPVQVMQLFSELSITFPGVDFEFHPHNDLGMATANALMALEYGAKGVSCTVNGVGERAGNAALEEVIMALSQYRKSTGKYTTGSITKLCHLVSKYARQEIHPSKPVVGDHAFMHESGIHARGILHDKLTYQPFDEEMTGGKPHKIVFGKHSGNAGIQHFFTQKGIHLNAMQLMLIIKNIKESAKRSRTILNEEHIMQVYEKLFMSA